MIHPTSNQIDAVFLALRHFIDDAGYGRYINDDWVNRAATAAATAMANVPDSIPQNAATMNTPKSVIYRKGTKK